MRTWWYSFQQIRETLFLLMFQSLLPPQGAIDDDATEGAPAASTILRGFASEHGKQDGIVALKHLQMLCAPQDDEALRSEVAQFNAFHMCDRETFQCYCIRYDKLCRPHQGSA
jgi:hypothetical protein